MLSIQAVRGLPRLRAPGLVFLAWLIMLLVGNIAGFLKAVKSTRRVPPRRLRRRRLYLQSTLLQRGQ